MLRTYEFYDDNFYLDKIQVDKISAIISNVEKGIYNEEEIRSLGKVGLIFCICEGKYEVFKTLVSPFSYMDGDKERYRYLLDAVSLGIVEYIKELPGSISEYWARYNERERQNAEFAGMEYVPTPIEVISRDAVIAYPSLKKELIDAILSVDKAKIMTTKIKDVLARQICGTGFPIRNLKDVIYYAELPLLYPCADLFRKNIITKSNDTGGCYSDFETDDSKVFIANIVVDYDALDDANRVVANALVESDNAYISENNYGAVPTKDLVIEVPCKRNETVYQVSKRMMELVSKFHKQDMVYGKLSVDDIYNVFESRSYFLTENELKEVYAILEKGYTSENILAALKYFDFIHFYYDAEEDIFWQSEYYYRKHREYLEDKCEFGSQGLK